MNTETQPNETEGMAQRPLLDDRLGFAAQHRVENGGRRQYLMLRLLMH